MLHKGAAERQEADNLMGMLIKHPAVREAIKKALRELIEDGKVRNHDVLIH